MSAFQAGIVQGRAEAEQEIADLRREIERLQLLPASERMHRCPTPDWFPKIRDLLMDVSLAAAYTGADLEGLPAHVAALWAAQSAP